MTASLQTRLAQGAARAADADWKAHAANCGNCGRKARGSQTAAPCTTGAELLAARTRANAAFSHERKLDKAPPVNMDTLFL